MIQAELNQKAVSKPSYEMKLIIIDETTDIIMVNVVVHIPDNVNARSRQDKINRIYNILSPLQPA